MADATLDDLARQAGGYAQGWDQWAARITSYPALAPRHERYQDEAQSHAADWRSLEELADAGRRSCGDDCPRCIAAVARLAARLEKPA